MTDAHLNRARLRDVTLSYADLTGADLTGANLTGADLTAANLTGAVVTPRQYSQAKLCRTTLPTAPSPRPYRRQATASVGSGSERAMLRRLPGPALLVAVVQPAADDEHHTLVHSSNTSITKCSLVYTRLNSSRAGTAEQPAPAAGRFQKTRRAAPDRRRGATALPPPGRRSDPVPEKIPDPLASRTWVHISSMYFVVGGKNPFWLANHGGTAE